ncbi:copper amine oxidase N-terminal domain-containing protein [Paenibacillus thalictri]|nr:copper amine oxidase N-terminal domain-containing protein [Paenibacillus thalictri]
MSFAFIFGAGGTVFAADPAEPKAVNWDAGIFIDGKMLVPLGELAKILNLSLTVDGQKSYTLSKDGLSVKLDLGDPAIQVNGKSLTLDVPPALEDGQAFVSLQFIDEALGSKVEWNEEKQHAVVQTKDSTL